MNENMRALVLEAPYTLNEAVRAIPEPGEGEALIKMEAVSICGSDIHAYRGNSLLLTYPRVLGHELCGRVVKINGAGDGIQPGDRVSIFPYISCGHCIACRQGRENCCTSLQVLGVHVDGGLSEYYTMRTDLLMKVPDTLDPKVAALIEPLAVSTHAVRRGGITAGMKVLVLGAGPIGLGVAEAATSFGAEVYMADISPERKAFVEERFGYTLLNPTDQDFDDQLRTWTNGEYPTCVIDSTGNQKSMANSINYLSATGRLVFVGLQSGTLDVSDPAFHIREAEIFASRVAQTKDFEYVLEKIENGVIRAERFITHTADISCAKTAMEEWFANSARVFKGIITFQ